MKAIKYVLILIILAVTLNSCYRDELCYLHPQGARVLVLADWQTKARVYPNAATLMIYNAESNELIREVRMPNPNRQTLDLPIGRYNIVIFNETLTGSHFDESIEYRNWGSFNSFEAFSKDDYISTQTKESTVKLNPDTLAVSRLYYEVTSEMIDKVHIHPTPENVVEVVKNADTIYFTPPRVISVCNITLAITNMRSVYSYQALLHGMAESYFLGNDTYATHFVSHPVRFYAATKRYLSYSPEIVKDTLYATMSVMGLAENIHPGETGSRPDINYIFDLNITLVNGDKHFFTWDLVEQERIALTREADHDQPHDVIDIQLDIDLPDVNGEGTGFDSNLSDWFEQIVDLNTNTLQFNSNGGYGIITPVRGSYNSKVTIPPCTFTPPVADGQKLTFKEWNTNKNGTGIAYKPNDKYTMPRGGGVLYAIWER